MVLAFSNENANIQSENGLLLDQLIRINYQGELDSESVIQNVNVSTIEVLNSDPTNTTPIVSEPPLDETIVPTIVPTPTPSPTPSIDPITARAQQILNDMTIEEKVGQMFIARCPEDQAAQQVYQYPIGGYILIGRDFTNKTYD